MEKIIKADIFGGVFGAEPENLAICSSRVELEPENFEFRRARVEPEPKILNLLELESSASRKIATDFEPSPYVYKLISKTVRREYKWTVRQSMDLRIQYTTLLERQLGEQKALIKMLEKGKLGAKERQTVLDTLKQLTNSIDQRRSSIKALEREMEISERRMAKVLTSFFVYTHMSIFAAPWCTIVSQTSRARIMDPIAKMKPNTVFFSTA